MRVGDCDDDDRLIVDAKYERVREASKQTSTNFRFDFWCCQGIGFDETNNPIELIQKIQTLAISPFIKPDESFIDFLLSE
ncbi:MAG: hypothetical protein ND895_12535 [Pyrinomonadaceae bacterium]|nr:hypothetical protein [Pyrinomonadaceae bacterium]